VILVGHLKVVISEKKNRWREKQSKRERKGWWRKDKGKKARDDERGDWTGVTVC